MFGDIMAGQPTPPGLRTPPEIAGVPYDQGCPENPLVSLKAGYVARGVGWPAMNTVIDSGSGDLYLHGLWNSP